MLNTNNKPQIKENVKVIYKHSLLHHSFFADDYVNKKVNEVGHQSEIQYFSQSNNGRIIVNTYIDKVNNLFIKFIQPLQINF